jgi:hypothetical protein
VEGTRQRLVIQKDATPANRMTARTRIPFLIVRARAGKGDQPNGDRGTPRPNGPGDCRQPLRRPTRQRRPRWRSAGEPTAIAIPRNGIHGDDFRSVTRLHAESPCTLRELPSTHSGGRRVGCPDSSFGYQIMVIERQRRGQAFSRHSPRRASIRSLAAGAALPISALGACRAGALAAVSAGSLGSCGRSESEPSDDGEQSARFDQCLHGVCCVGYGREPFPS